MRRWTFMYLLVWGNWPTNCPGACRQFFVFFRKTSYFQYSDVGTIDIRVLQYRLRLQVYEFFRNNRPKPDRCIRFGVWNSCQGFGTVSYERLLQASVSFDRSEVFIFIYLLGNQFSYINNRRVITVFRAYMHRGHEQ